MSDYGDDLTSFQNSYGNLAFGQNSGSTINGIKADYTNVDNIANGNATSSDWGGVTGGTIGAITGGPEGAQQGADIGREIAPYLAKITKNIFGK